MRASQLLLWGLGGFLVYEVIAWKVNGNRVAQSLATNGITPPLLPLDLIGSHFGYPATNTVPAAVAAGLANPQAARDTTFNATNYPGVAATPAVGSTTLPDPNNLLVFPNLGKTRP